MKPIGEILPDNPKLRELMRRWNALSPEERERQRRESDAESERRDREWNEELRRDRVDARLAQICHNYRDARLDRPLDGMEPAYREAQAWVKAFLRDAHHRGLLVCGPVGTGKSWLAWAIFSAIAEADGTAVEVVKVRRLLNALRPDGDAGQDDVTRLCRVPLLVLDDLVAHTTSEWVVEQLLDVLDERHDEARPVVVTTNQRPEKLHEIVGERLASRLAGMTVPLFMTGPDRRHASTRQESTS